MKETNFYATLKNSSRADQLQVMQFLMTKLAKEEEIQLQQNIFYSIKSPYNSHEAAHKLGKLLEEDKQ